MTKMTLFYFGFDVIPNLSYLNKMFFFVLYHIVLWLCWNVILNPSLLPIFLSCFSGDTS